MQIQIVNMQGNDLVSQEFFLEETVLWFSPIRLQRQLIFCMYAALVPVIVI